MDDEGAANPDGVSMLKMLAEDGDFASQNSLLVMYGNGEGISKNLDKSLYWANLAVVNKECNYEDKIGVHFHIGHIFMEQKKYNDALKNYTFIFEYENIEQKLKIFAYLCMADAHNLLQDDKDVEIYENIINKYCLLIDKNHAYHIHLKLGGIYMKRKNFKKAIEEFTSSICLKNSYELKSNSVDDFSILNNIGYAHEMCENFGDALKYYILASKKDAHLQPLILDICMIMV